MVDILTDQFAKLVLQVVAKRRVGDGFSDEGNLGPDQNAVLVGQVVVPLRMLIVGESQPGDAEFPQHAKIGVDLGLAYGRPATGTHALVDIDAMHAIGMAIQQQAPVRRQNDGANPGFDLSLIQNGARSGVLDGNLAGIEIGIGDAVPQMRRQQRAAQVRHGDGARRSLYPGMQFQNRSVPGLEPDAHEDGARLRPVIGDANAIGEVRLA